LVTQHPSPPFLRNQPQSWGIFDGGKGHGQVGGLASGWLPSCRELIRAESRRMQIRSTCAGQKPPVSQGAAETNAAEPAAHSGAALRENGVLSSPKKYVPNSDEAPWGTQYGSCSK